MLNKLLIALLTVVCSLQDAAALSLRTNTAEASELRRRNVDGEVSGGDSPGADGSASENEGCLDACTELAPCAGETRKQRIARNRRLRKELKDGMDAEEVVVNKYIRTMDFALMIPMMCFYVFFGWLNQGHWQNPEYAGSEMIDGVKISSGNEDARVGQMPTWLRGTTVILTMMSMFSLFRHAFDGAPVLKALGSTYKVMQTFGRWIFLTRWCLAFQMLHFMALGALAIKPDLWPLAGITPGCAPISGAIGSFVTVQFFSLVYPTRRFLDEIEDMKKLGYPQLWFYNMFTHSLPLPLAIFDAVFLEVLYIFDFMIQ